MASQSVGKNLPSRITYPAGVCIQLFTERIQKDDMSVPEATITAARKCAQRGTSPRPKSSTPRNVASRKNAIRSS